MTIKSFYTLCVTHLSWSLVAMMFLLHALLNHDFLLVEAEFKAQVHFHLRDMASKKKLHYGEHILMFEPRNIYYYTGHIYTKMRFQQKMPSKVKILQTELLLRVCHILFCHRFNYAATSHSHHILYKNSN